MAACVPRLAPALATPRQGQPLWGARCAAHCSRQQAVRAVRGGAALRALGRTILAHGGFFRRAHGAHARTHCAAAAAACCWRTGDMAPRVRAHPVRGRRQTDRRRRRAGHGCRLAGCIGTCADIQDIGDCSGVLGRHGRGTVQRTLAVRPREADIGRPALEERVVRCVPHGHTAAGD